MGLITAAGGEFQLKYLKGQQKYPAGPALTKECSPLEKDAYATSFTLLKMISVETQAELNLKENEIIDVKHPTLCWNSGRVSSIEKQGPKNIVKVKVADTDLQFVFPSPEYENSIGKCGTKFKGNKCEVVHNAPSNPGKSMKKQALECDSFRNGDCASNPLDCVFED